MSCIRGPGAPSHMRRRTTHQTPARLVHASIRALMSCAMAVALHSIVAAVIVVHVASAVLVDATYEGGKWFFLCFCSCFCFPGGLLLLRPRLHARLGRAKRDEGGWPQRSAARQCQCQQAATKGEGAPVMWKRRRVYGWMAAGWVHGGMGAWRLDGWMDGRMGGQMAAAAGECVLCHRGRDSRSNPAEGSCMYLTGI